VKCSPYPQGVYNGGRKVWQIYMSRYVCVGEGKLGRRPHTGAKIEKKKSLRKVQWGHKAKYSSNF
jgi:hypothetical protein